ncbi:4-hydroxybenzoate octaprenyltransferase [bacterium]|nr:4-hydroxybenzoate octaprenyltransferase [bacterium]
MLRPYLRLSRLDRPIGTWLLVWPAWWAISLASTSTKEEADTNLWFGLPDPFLLVLFGIGALAMRGAGCTYNDIVDRKVDAQVERTRGRPIPSGAASVPAAAGWLIFQALIGFAVLITFNVFAIWLGVASLALIAAYPFMKRITWWPQLWLGLAFNYGALLGWAAATGRLSVAPLLLYAGGIFWTLGYDTIYAHQDTEDDALVGVKSSARWLGNRTSSFLYTTYAMTIILITAAGTMVGLHWVFYMFLAAAAAHLAWQAHALKIESPEDCLTKFRSNHHTGALVFLAIIAGSILG